jgi:DNA-binding MarR family transcriptional regulator
VIDLPQKSEPGEGSNADTKIETTKRYSLRTARHLQKLRLERSKVFGDKADLFGEPAWDILLALYIAFGEDKQLMRTEAAVVGFIPQTTGRRILSELNERGLVRSEKDMTDKRVWFEILTSQGVTLMEACLSNMVEPRRRAKTKAE